MPNGFYLYVAKIVLFSNLSLSVNAIHLNSLCFYGKCWVLCHRDVNVDLIMANHLDYDTGPALKQHKLNGSYFLGIGPTTCIVYNII